MDLPNRLIYRLKPTILTRFHTVFTLFHTFLHPAAGPATPSQGRLIDINLSKTAETGRNEQKVVNNVRHPSE